MKKAAPGSPLPSACRKSNPNILVMQPAQDWKAKNTPCPLNLRDRGASLSNDRCVRVSL
jgi:hypothetical protein